MNADGPEREAAAPQYDQSVPPRTHLERERKLLGGHRAARVARWRELEARVFTSTYFDTADRRLLRRGVTLRRRVENGRSRWQLKLPQLSGRLEVEADGGPLPHPELYELLTAFLGGRKLAPAATMRTRRRGVRVRNGDGEAEVVADEVAILEGAQEVDGFDELEVELVSGDETLLDALERRLHEAGATQGTGEVKLERALGVSASRPTTRPHARRRRSSTCSISCGRSSRRSSPTTPACAWAPTPRTSTTSRVAVRRLRAMLRAVRPMLAPEWSEPLRAELKWLAGELGPLRDADVFLDYLEHESERSRNRTAKAREELFDLVAGDRLGAHAGGPRALRSDRYLALLQELERTARAPRIRSGDGLDAGSRARSSASCARRRSASRGSPDEEVHALRINGKRARYAAELAQRRRRNSASVPRGCEAVPGRRRRTPGRCGGGAAPARAPAARATTPRSSPAVSWSGNALAGVVAPRAAAGLEAARARGYAAPGADRPRRRRRRHPTGDGCGVEVLLVHRPRYDDWTFPKGKCERGEADEACALREVEEETGFRCELGEELASTRYRDRRGRPKTVRYWQMRVVDGDFVPGREVDEICWLTPSDADRMLTYRGSRGAALARGRDVRERLAAAAARSASSSRTAPSRTPPAPSDSGRPSWRCTSARITVPASSVSARWGAMRNRVDTSACERRKQLDRPLELAPAELVADELRGGPCAAPDRESPPSPAAARSR